MVNEELCGLCSGCASVCPRGAITVSERRLIVDEGLCNDCGLCVKACPVGAITMERRSE
nr:4Fe-4S dicluster domain-containing protein [Candidatus Bathyarchaeota archaeon]